MVAATDEDRATLMMALSLRKEGAVGGPFKAADGLWYILRVKTSPLEHAKPFDAVMTATVKNALVDQRRRKLVDELDGPLRAKAKIEEYDDALAKVPVPDFK